MTVKSAAEDLRLLRPTVMDVDLNALLSNYRAIVAHVQPAKVMPILKADAYGHGLAVCAQQLQQAGAPIFGVAFLEEAIALRQAGITIPILSLGGICGRQLEAFLAHDIDITASSVTKLEQIDAQAKALGRRARVHLKIDTGMERIGVHYYTAESLLNKTLECTHSDIVGIFSHLACSESEDPTFTSLQLERFEECTSFFAKHSLPTPQKHLANSGAICQHPSTYLDLVRPGLLLYGVNPLTHSNAAPPVTPVMSFRSEVVYFKVVMPGAGVSYDLTWTASRQTRVVTVPVGYGDGYPRTLSNNAEVLIKGKRYPIIGRICMDQFMVDIGPDGEAYNGDEVTLLGTQGQESITVTSLATQSETDPRDILLRLALRAPRRYHLNNAIFVA